VVQAQSVVILIVVALFIALGLSPLVRGLVRRGVKRGLAILLVLVGVLVVLALALFAIVPVFAEQIGNLFTAAPDILQDTLRNPQVNSLNERFQLISRAQEFVSSGTLVQRAFGGLVGAAGAVLGAVFSGFTLLILALYFLVALPAIRSAIIHLAPSSRRDRAGYLTDQIFLRISSYISGTFVVAVIAGVVSYIFLLIVGLGEFALALAVLVAVLDIISLSSAPPLARSSWSSSASSSHPPSASSASRSTCCTSSSRTTSSNRGCSRRPSTSPAFSSSSPHSSVEHCSASPAPSSPFPSPPSHSSSSAKSHNPNSTPVDPTLGPSPSEPRLRTWRRPPRNPAGACHLHKHAPRGVALV